MFFVQDLHHSKYFMRIIHRRNLWQEGTFGGKWQD
jgi:hypothetical protein